MDRAGSTAFPRLVWTRPALGLCALLALGACQTTPGTPGSAEMSASAPAAAAGPSSRVIERDVEAPEVFHVSETGLWDGRPSLGGVWVAHPNAHDPERVMIRNAATGQTVIGALFRRERENPGPRFQVSSEAANALGILAGAPTAIEVTALRLQRVEMELEPEPATAAEETLALAPAGTAPAAAAATPTPVPAPVATPASAPEGTVEIAVADPPRRRTLADLFRRRPREPEGIAETTLAPVAGVSTATVAAGTAAASVAAPDTQPAAPAPAPQGARIDRPFVQVGIFSVEQNAQNTRAQMQAAGLSAEVRRGRVGENLFWRVVVGPAGSTAERGEILRRVRGLGFADAYAVVR